jgi:hypothetical protein
MTGMKEVMKRMVVGFNFMTPPDHELLLHPH